MRSFSRLATRRPVSVLCAALLMLQIASTTLAPLPASAQIGTIEVAVVDFYNTSKMPNELFGTMATDAVVVELLRSGKFTVTSADSLRAEMEDLGYRSKDDRVLKVSMTPSMMIRLGQELVADSVVSGEISSIKVDKDNKRAEVRIAVRMLDVASGEWVNGAIATGTSHPRIGYSAERDTDLIIEAINNAARKAVETMVQYIIPEATILGTVGTNEVLLNKGSQDGIDAGMEMIVLRRSSTGIDEVVGRVRVSKVSDTDASAYVVSSTQGVKPQDRVRAVYELPKDTDGKEVQAPRTDTKKRIAKGSKLLWGLLLLVGIATIFKGGGDRPEEVPDTIAVAGVSPDITVRMEEGAIAIASNNPKNIRLSDIIEYHVWMDNYGNASIGGESQFVGPVLAPDQLTAAPWSGALGSFDHFTTIDTSLWSPLSYSYADADHALGTASIENQSGITIGKTHNFWVSCLYRRIPAKSEDEGGEITYWETTPVFAGRATYVSRPASQGPGDLTGVEEVDLSSITFEWLGSRGADKYVIEVSSTPTFDRSLTWVSEVYQPTNADGMPIAKTFTDVLSTSTELGGLPAGTRLYWRVGARNSADIPGPYPAGPTPTVDGAKSSRYIYSDPNGLFSFTTPGELPGEPPGIEPPAPPP